VTVLGEQVDQREREVRPVAGQHLQRQGARLFGRGSGNRGNLAELAHGAQPPLPEHPRGRLGHGGEHSGHRTSVVTIGKYIPHACWMQDVPDDTLVTALSIPGTHNAGCVSGVLGLAQTQNLDIDDQLDAGIRFLDIRLAHYQDDLFVHHDVVFTDKSYTDVLASCVKFLQKYPSESILMSVMEESRLDGWLGWLAPSEVLGTLYRGDITNDKHNTCCLSRPWKTRHGSVSETRGCSITS
jgi:hypothetical protein